MEAKPPMIEVQTPLDVAVLFLFGTPDFLNERMPYVVRVIDRKLMLIRYKHSNGRLKTNKSVYFNYPAFVVHFSKFKKMYAWDLRYE